MRGYPKRADSVCSDKELHDLSIELSFVNDTYLLDLPLQFHFQIAYFDYDFFFFGGKDRDFNVMISYVF